MSKQLRGPSAGSKKQEFEYGPLAKGFYAGLAALLVLVLIAFPKFFLPYLALIFLLGVGLRPLIERTGLHAWYVSVNEKIQSRRYRNINEARAIEVERKMRDDKRRRSRVKDPDLPRHW